MEAHTRDRLTFVLGVLLSCVLVLAGPLASQVQAMADESGAKTTTSDITPEAASEELGRTEAISDGDHLAILNGEGTFSLAESQGRVTAQAETVPGEALAYHVDLTVMHAVATDGGFYLMCDGEFLSCPSDGTLAWADETTGSCVWQAQDAGAGRACVWCTTSDGARRYLAFVDGAFTVTDADTDSSHLRLYASTGHIFREERREPTCTEDGSVVRTCVACGETVEVTLDALGHDWGAWDVTEKATETQDGAETRTCRHDPNHTETRVIPKASSEATDVSITYDLAGGTLENLSDTLTVMSSAGAQIVMLDAPVREGYVFMCWESPRYRLNPGDTYSVTSDDTFTAVWRSQTLRDALEEADGVPSASRRSGEDDPLDVASRLSGGTISEGERPSAERPKPEQTTAPAAPVGSPQTPGTRDSSVGAHILIAVCAAGISLTLVSGVLRRV